MNFRGLCAAVLAAFALAGCCGEEGSENPTLFAAVCQAEKDLAEPNTGLWWNPQENGRGFFIERQDERILVSAYVFDDDGRATWSTGFATQQSDGSYTGTLTRYSGGQTLEGSYRPPDTSSAIATMVLEFDTATTGTLEVKLTGSDDKHLITLEQFRGDGGPPSNATFANGTWWNEDESGRAFVIEVQGNNVTLGSFMYDKDGSPVWYRATGQLATTSSFTLTLTQFADGQTLTGPYQQPRTLSASLGSVTFQARTATKATMTLPDGRQVPLQRFTFD
ncbi:hypothetical protein FN976_12380 [Caenimonas sedimenti]|uniref:Lipoprotein n=1 Tax=Caenimonas sedimenti TaxID=2596921 RepID=A0A562ZR81_9BURK|nr:hypothetical protein [Caenimonas sedimenti]TWO71109.1 hypothetical protein FN976_12380 [Caenimonas sedimenti]